MACLSQRELGLEHGGDAELFFKDHGKALGQHHDLRRLENLTDGDSSSDDSD